MKIPYSYYDNRAARKITNSSNGSKVKRFKVDSEIPEAEQVIWELGNTPIHNSVC